MVQFQMYKFNNLARVRVSAYMVYAKSQVKSLNYSTPPMERFLAVSGTF